MTEMNCDDQLFDSSKQFASDLDLYQRNHMKQSSPAEFSSLKLSHNFGQLVAVLVIALNFLLVGCSSGNAPPASASPATKKSYTTSFPLAEDPISESQNWINGGTVGLDWTNVQTTSALAFGTESGSGGYDDSTAVLTGTWSADQTVQATVHTLNQKTDPVFEEVELRLRTTIIAHAITGYEINFRCTRDGSQYIQIVRWNGPVGSFNFVNTTKGPGLHNGDIVKATISGRTITVYINGTEVLQGMDSTYTSGRPGIGFFLQGAAGVNGDYGFTSFTATDELTTN